MDVDLLLTPKGEVGLLSNENLIKKVAGIILDTDNGILTLEFTDMDFLDLNIPVEQEHFGTLDLCPLIHIGAIKNKHISQAYQVPLMFLDDPYRAELFKNVKPSSKPLDAFYYFLTNCVLGQPVHRKDAGNEDSLGCILGDNMPSDLQFAPHLARRHSIETRPEAIHTPNAPGIGLGGSTGSASSPTRSTYASRRAEKKNDTEDTQDDT